VVTLNSVRACFIDLAALKTPLPELKVSQDDNVTNSSPFREYPQRMFWAMLPLSLRGDSHMYRAAFFSLLLIGSAHADVSDAPVRIHNHGVTAILHNSMKTITLAVGDNPIGRPRYFTCRSSAGCVIVMDASIREKNVQSGIMACSFIDGIAAPPGCGFDPAFYNTDTMRHTITTIVNTLNAGPQVVGWATEYTIYERKVKGAE